MSTVHISRPIAPDVPYSKLLRAVAVARASLRALVDRAYREVPAAVGPVSRTQEAAATREYAAQFLKSDPRFAADLCAAADRHEGGENA